MFCIILQKRFLGKISKLICPIFNKILNEIQKLAICNYTKRHDETEQSRNLSMIRKIANYMLKQNHTGGFFPNWQRLNSAFHETAPQIFQTQTKIIGCNKK